MRQRWYDPTLQRFLSRDRVRRTNRYRYAANKPMNLIDPSGLDPWGMNPNDYQQYQFDYLPWGPGVTPDKLARAQRTVDNRAGNALDTPDLFQFDFDSTVFGETFLALWSVAEMLPMGLALLGKIGLVPPSRGPLPGQGGSQAPCPVNSSTEAIDDFMLRNEGRFDTKLGAKLGQGRLGIPPSTDAAGIARERIRETLEFPTSTTGPFPTRGGNQAYDIYSDMSGYTVRVRDSGEFDTLIPGQSTKFGP